MSALAHALIERAGDFGAMGHCLHSGLRAAQVGAPVIRKLEGRRRHSSLMEARPTRGVGGGEFRSVQGEFGGGGRRASLPVQVALKFAGDPPKAVLETRTIAPFDIQFGRWLMQRSRLMSSRRMFLSLARGGREAACCERWPWPSRLACACRRLWSPMGRLGSTSHWQSIAL